MRRYKAGGSQEHIPRQLFARVQDFVHGFGAQAIPIASISKTTVEDIPA
jgi:hypothetical protein